MLFQLGPLVLLIICQSPALVPDTMTLENVSSWAGSPEVTLVTEGGSQVKVHRLLLGLYSDQWRLTLQGLEISQPVFILQGVDELQLGRLVGEIYQTFRKSQIGTI